MTVPRRDGSHQSAFLQWIRSVRELDSHEYQLSITDSDLWIHRFSNRNEAATSPNAPMIEHIQLIEIKTFSAECPFAQADTLDVIDRVLRQASVKNGRRWPIKILDSRSGRTGCFRSVRWLGLHLLQLSSDRPDSSDRILWDRHQISEQHLIELLRLERDPDHPGKMLDTRRHHARPAREQLPQFGLFHRDAAE